MPLGLQCSSFLVFYVVLFILFIVVLCFVPNVACVTGFFILDCPFCSLWCLFSQFACGGLWCLTQISTIFQLYRDGQVYCWRKQEWPEKTTDQSLTNFITSMLYPVHLEWQSNYHTFTMAAIFVYETVNVNCKISLKLGYGYRFI